MIEPLLQHCNKTTYGKRQILQFCIPWNDEKVGKFIARHCSTEERRNFLFEQWVRAEKASLPASSLALSQNSAHKCVPQFQQLSLFQKFQLSEKLIETLHSYFAAFW